MNTLIIAVICIAASAADPAPNTSQENIEWNKALINVYQMKAVLSFGSSVAKLYAEEDKQHGPKVIVALDAGATYLETVYQSLEEEIVGKNLTVDGAEAHFVNLSNIFYEPILPIEELFQANQKVGDIVLTVYLAGYTEAGFYAEALVDILSNAGASQAAQVQLGMKSHHTFSDFANRFQLKA